MLDYPLISIVLIADCSMPQLASGLQALDRLDYPKDQLEFFLIIPAEKSLPVLPKITPRLRVIRFDATLGWNPQQARLEGITLAKGEFVQFLDGAFSLKNDWLRRAVTFFDHNQVFGISGEVVSRDLYPHQVAEDGDELSINAGSLTIVDGLYDRRKLKELVVDGSEFEIFAVTQPPLPEEIRNTPAPMAEVSTLGEQIRSRGPRQTAPSMQLLLTRYMYTRNKE